MEALIFRAQILPGPNPHHPLWMTGQLSRSNSQPLKCAYEKLKCTTGNPHRCAKAFKSPWGCTFAVQNRAAGVNICTVFAGGKILQGGFPQIHSPNSNRLYLKI
jgi:hypothetical protein